MGLGRNQLLVVSDGLKERVVYCAFPLNLAEVVAKDKPTLVIADEVIVSGRVDTAGYDLSVFCRALRFVDGGIITTDGRPGFPSFSPGVRKESAYVPGADGLDGDAGGDGSPAGNIRIATYVVTGEIKISSVGGLGGRPMDGGHGRQGGKGHPGSRITLTKSSDDASAANGGQGLQGGRVGLPGARGKGGNGGSVHLAVMAGGVPSIQGIAVGHGLHGAAANPGNAGLGGEGGDPGSVYRIMRRRVFLGPVQVDPTIPLKFHAVEADTVEKMLAEAVMVIEREPLIWEEYEVYERSGSRGDTGLDGHTRDSEVEARLAEPIGVNGNIDTTPINTAAFAENFDGAVLELLSCGVEDQYRKVGNSITPELRKQIEFLLRVCVDDINLSQVKREVLARVYSMAQKINLDLDYFGYSRERVPLLSFETYSQEIISIVLPSVRNLERSFNEYWDNAASKGEQRKSLIAAIAEAKNKDTLLTLAYQGLEKDASELLESIPSLDLKVSAAEQTLLQAKQELESAINRKSNGCNLASTLIAASTIVAGVASGGAGFIAAASAGAKLYKDFKANNESLSKLWSAKNVLEEDLKTLSGAAGTIASSIEAIQSGMVNLDQSRKRIPQFRMRREEFDKVAKDFADLPEAAEYREAGYEFLKCVEARNQAILDYNGMLAQLVELQAQQATGQRGVTNLQSALSGTSDPSEAHIISVMSRMYLDALAVAAQMVHAERKSVSYLFGQPSDAPISALNTATIESAHILAISAWTNGKESFKARRETRKGVVQIELREIVTQSYWDGFKRSRNLSFTIRPDHPKFKFTWAGLPAYRITGIELQLEGAKLPDPTVQFSWHLTHGGTELIYRRNAKPVYFSHVSVSVTGMVSIAGDPPYTLPEFTEGKLYAGLSPFSTWLLSLESDQDLLLDLSGLTSARLKLSGYYIDN